MSYPMTQIGGRAFHHSSHENAPDIEQEYDRLRDLARQEHAKRQQCFDKSHQAYERGDGAAAHELSEEGKKHGKKMDDYNKQASDFIFRENNADGRVTGDEIDLHGQFVEEAEDLLEERIRYAQQHGQTHLHVIVGKGNHSVNHVQKLKPRCEKVCKDLGLQFRTEDNAGRMYVDLTGGDAHLPSHLGGGGQLPQSQQPQSQQPPAQPHHTKPHHEQHHSGGQHHTYADAVSHPDDEPQAQPSHPGTHAHQGNQQQQYQGGYQQQQQSQNQNDEIDEDNRKGIPRLLRAFKSCCVVM